MPGYDPIGATAGTLPARHPEAAMSDALATGNHTIKGIMKPHSTSHLLQYKVAKLRHPGKGKG